jgi:RNA polymerase sigma factor (TIGR02999 family)
LLTKILGPRTFWGFSCRNFRLKRSVNYWQTGTPVTTRLYAGRFLLVYDELRRIAHHDLRNERPGHTLRSTALVHEAYLRLEKQGASPFQNREHFLAICVQLMRQILVHYARGRKAGKRDGGFRLELDDALAFKTRSVDMVALAR